MKADATTEKSLNENSLHRGTSSLHRRPSDRAHQPCGGDD